MIRKAVVGILGTVLTGIMVGCGGSSYQALPIVVRSIIVPCPMTVYDGIEWSPDGKQIVFNAFTDGNGYYIFVMNPDGSGIRQLTLTPDFVTSIQWSPDSQQVAYISRATSTLNIVSLDGSAAKLASDTWSYTWSPDSRSIAYGVKAPPRGSSGDIYVMGRDGSGVAALTNDLVRDGGPAWSPDGQWIAFHATVNSLRKIFVMRADGSEAALLTPDGDNEDPRWSPDGSMISYTSIRSIRREIYLINRDGTDERLISAHYSLSDYRWLPDSRHIALAEVQLTMLMSIGTVTPFSWSPDGKRVAFIDFDHSNPNVAAPEIYVMNRDGSGRTRLTDNPGKGYCLNWPF